MDKSRRDFFRRALAATALLGAARPASAQGAVHEHTGHGPPGTGGSETAPSAGQAKGELLPVETPDIPKLPWRMDNGVKVFHLIPEVVKREFLPGKVVDVWGFNGSMPGPTIAVNQGDRVRIIVENRLPEPTSMHWQAWRSPSQWMECREFRRIPSRQGRSLSTSSPSTNTVLSSTTPTWPCRR